MKKIASFTVDHDKIGKGMYVSRIDGDVITYDVRMKIPNGGEYLSMPAAHTLEHLLATYIRNTPFENSVVYVGPMGCGTGFYVLLRDDVSKADAIALVRGAMAFAASFEGEIPGSEKKECGNYLGHDLDGAKAEAAQAVAALENWTEKDLEYKV